MIHHILSYEFAYSINFNLISNITDFIMTWNILYYLIFIRSDKAHPLNKGHWSGLISICIILNILIDCHVRGIPYVIASFVFALLIYIILMLGINLFRVISNVKQ